ncbi:NUDIX domain-containing protein [soil metagenome]
MPRISAGILAYRRSEGALEVLLVHPGGPLWAKRDLGAWTIPKGEVDPGEELLAAAQREFTEETGFTASAPFLLLSPVKQKGGKTVHAWACEGDFDAAACRSMSCRIEWPAGSGRWLEFPEIDRAEYFPPEIAANKINPAQVAFLEELSGKLV